MKTKYRMAGVFQSAREEERVQDVYLRLMRNGSGFALHAVDSDGVPVASGSLLQISKVGDYSKFRIVRSSSVNSFLGEFFDLDPSGRIRDELRTT